MSKDNYKLLGLDENATDEEVEESYARLKQKYGEERWLEGEAGNEAARMLGKLDAAYREILAERKEKARRDNDNGDVYAEIGEDIRAERLVEAQTKLDDCNVRDGEWHYLQSVLYYKKGWMNESKKQLEIALQLEPDNGKYKEAYDRVNGKMNYQSQSPYGEERAEGQEAPETEQMGGTGCSQCLDCCYTYLCVNCLCNCCCNCR